MIHAPASRAALDSTDPAPAGFARGIAEAAREPADRAADAALLADLRAARPLLWTNPGRGAVAAAPAGGGAAAGAPFGAADTDAAIARFARWRPALRRLFPDELADGDGAIESPLLPVPALQRALGLAPAHGRLWVKADHGLPVAGSIKARGGIHEVLEFAEGLALRHGLLAAPDADHAALAGPAARALFAGHQVAVGSTGNLGLAIGVMASALGFRAVVHMSSDAKAWKKERLRRRGVEVVEHAGDYEQAVAAGRRQAAADPRCHFVDDENSRSLFAGYSAAARHLQAQLAQQGVAVDAEHPLFVHLPCGVGGAPGGVAFGLAQAFGPHAHCFFAEPTQSPCFLVAMMARDGSHPSVYDAGLTNRTEADGLAVPRASALVAALMRPVLAGVFTVEDGALFRHLRAAMDTEGLRIEPSAAAGFDGPGWVCRSAAGRDYLARHGLDARMARATHIAWTTGGLFVPDEEYARFLARGSAPAAGG
jgi:D-serine dehydratase